LLTTSQIKLIVYVPTNIASLIFDIAALKKFVLVR